VQSHFGILAFAAILVTAIYGAYVTVAEVAFVDKFRIFTDMFGKFTVTKLINFIRCSSKCHDNFFSGEIRF